MNLLLKLKLYSTSEKLFGLIALLVLISGCGQGPIAGGTPGVLRTDGNPLRDVQVTVYSTTGDKPLGYAVTSSDGTFELVAQDSTGPLFLTPGSYIFVLESVGAPTELPVEYLKRESTPLKLDWDDSDLLEFNVPGLKLK